MNKNLKKQIKSAFDAPPSPGREAFLKSLSYSNYSYFDFIKDQIAYIRLQTWAAFIFVIFGILLAFKSYDFLNYDMKTIWYVSSLLPFFALTVMTELQKSRAYNMSELEMSCKHNYAHIVITKLLIMGIISLLLFIVLMILFVVNIELSIIRLTIYMFTPYLVTCLLTFLVVNRINTKDTNYICASIAIFVSLLNTIISLQMKDLFLEHLIGSWTILFIFSLVFIIEEVYRFIRNSEDSTCHLI